MSRVRDPSPAYIVFMGFWVYILKSDKDGKLYIGQTSNLEKR
ncbi:MAG: hypothetical protein DRP26_06545 [Candidatus Zixiibacteriota bacterium]|nr:MAG: hypothetical protein DRP26_06545 [candidate division Zixibacteria bacterium]